jgi:hypothetical protein
MGEDMLMRKLLELPNGEYELVGWALALAAFCRFNVLEKPDSYSAELFFQKHRVLRVSCGVARSWMRSLLERRHAATAFLARSYSCASCCLSHGGVAVLAFWEPLRLRDTVSGKGLFGMAAM